MADRSFVHLQKYDIQLHFMDTDGGEAIDRDEDGFPLVNQSNIQKYRDAGVDELVKAMRDLTQQMLIDVPPGNTFLQAFPPLENYHKQIERPVAEGIAETLLENSTGSSSQKEALSNIYTAVVDDGLMQHFPVKQDKATFNLVPSGIPPPGFAVLQSTTITTPPKPTQKPLKEKYDGFAAQGVEYDDEGGATEIPAPTSLIGQFFDTYMQAVETQTQLLHSGVTPVGTPITLPAQVKFTI